MSKDLIYEKIADHLKAAIENGSLKAGDAIYSENLLCEKFQVSRTSVRKAIRQMVEENLLVSHQGKGTFVKSRGHGVIHNAICVVNHWSRRMRDEAFDSYFKDVVLGAERAIEERGAVCMIYSGVINSPEEIAAKMAHIKVDGLAIDARYQSYFQDGLEAFKAISPHIVLMDGNPAESRLPTISPDAEKGFEEILQLVREKNGGAPLVFLYHDQEASYRKRLEGFKKACAKSGLAEPALLNYAEGLPLDMFSNVDHYPLIHQRLERWTRSLPKASGTIVCACDYAAAKAIKALNNLGFKAPEDFRVSGFCGIGFGALTAPELTTVKVDSSLIGETAVVALFEMIVAKTWTGDGVLPVKLLRRGSL